MPPIVGLPDGIEQGLDEFCTEMQKIGVRCTVTINLKKRGIVIKRIDPDVRDRGVAPDQVKLEAGL